jgi:hypothetical protein
MFQTLFHGSFFLLKQKKRKTIENKRNAKKGRSFPSSSHFALSLLVPAFAVPFLPFCFKHFFLASSSSQAEEENKRKKMQRREGVFFQVPILPSHF